MDWNHPSVLIAGAETYMRLAGRSDDPVEASKLRQLAQEYDAKARGMQSPPAPLDEEPTAQEHALGILREFEQARKALVGRAVALSDGKFGTVKSSSMTCMGFE